MSDHKGIFYVAAGSHEFERARRCMRALEADGWKNSHDWTDAVERLGSGSELPADERAAIARMDLDAVLTADLLLVLVPADGGAGVHTELGIALGANRLAGKLGIGEMRVIASGHHDRNIFSSLAEKCFDTDEQAIDALTGW